MQPDHNTLLIVGAGGHASVVADAALAMGAWSNVLVTETREPKAEGEFLAGVARMDRDLLATSQARVHVAIGDAPARERESAAWRQRLATVVHPQAAVSRFALVGVGTFVAAQAVVAPRASVGVSVIVNHGAVVDHDCRVGDYSHVAPGATLGGAASIGARVLLGAGARLLPRVTVCDDVVVGAGAVVIESIATPGVYAGVPARRVR